MSETGAGPDEDAPGGVQLHIEDFPPNTVSETGDGPLTPDEEQALRSRVRRYGGAQRRDIDRILATLDALRAEHSDSEPGLRERVAEAIYDAMRENDPEGRDRPWVPGGNSLKQEEARGRARLALSSEARRSGRSNG